MQGDGLLIFKTYKIDKLYNRLEGMKDCICHYKYVMQLYIYMLYIYMCYNERIN